MKLIILGAAGKTGAHLVRQALEEGHLVTAFVRDAQKLDITDKNLTVVVGDARDVNDLAIAIKDQDAVISALGSNKPADNLMAASTSALIEAMQKNKVRRVIMMSSFLASSQFNPGKIAKLVNWLAKPLVRDKTSAEELLKQSDLDWTIVYATRLDGAKPGNYRVLEPDETVTLNDSIARSDVADFLLEQVEDGNSIKKSLVITGS